MRNEVEVVIVGGGAAGVAAGRRLREAGIDALIVEARPRLGGRAWTVADGHGHALDLGCGWLHSADRNPWGPIALLQGHTIDKTPPPWTRPSGQIGLPASQAAAFGKALRQFRARVEAYAAKSEDRAGAACLEPLGHWNPLIDAVSTFYSGVELDRVSAIDLARYEDSGVNWRVVEGYGRTVAGHGQGLNVQLNCAAARIDCRGRTLVVETTLGPILANAAIITIPSALLAARPDFFVPALPDKTAAAAALPLGLADKLFLALSDADEFEADCRAFGDPSKTATAAYQFRPFGRPMIEVYFGGALAADLESGGADAFVAFATGELTGLFGSAFARRITPLPLHGWGADPYALGSYSYAVPGGADCRARLAAPVDDRLFFAGEACSVPDYSTAHGAYATGLAAAGQVIAARRS
jgi:monoamine oxidase